jgi:hypothetical protein
MSEVRPVPFAPGYFVSDDGRVFSEKCGSRRELKTGTSEGYPSVNLRIDGKTVPMKVHRIVARTFLGEPGADMDVRHLDGSRDNNYVSNLVWGTRSENMRDRDRHGRNPQHLYPERRCRGDRHWTRTRPDSVARGSTNPSSKLTEDDVARIRQRLSGGATRASVAREYGVTNQSIGYIARGVTWRHVPTSSANTRLRSNS